VKLNTGDKPVHLIFIPVSAEEGLQRMRDGKGDIAASNIPIIPQFQELVDFSDPIRERAREVLVTDHRRRQLPASKISREKRSS
jgi:extracellular solute-binding protein (family 3)